MVHTQMTSPAVEEEGKIGSARKECQVSHRACKEMWQQRNT